VTVERLHEVHGHLTRVEPIDIEQGMEMTAGLDLLPTTFPPPTYGPPKDAGRLGRQGGLTDGCPCCYREGRRARRQGQAPYSRGRDLAVPIGDLWRPLVSKGRDLRLG